MRIFVTTAIFLLSAGFVLGQEPSVSPTPSPTATAASTYVRPDRDERVKRYVKGMFGPKALGYRVVTSAVMTWANSPTEWGEHWDGFGKRFASATGTSIVKNTTKFGLDESFKLDSYFYRSQKRTTPAKIKNALVSPFIARNQHGKKVVGFPHLIGTYTGTIVAAETWFPDRFDWKDGLKGGTISLGADVFFNLVKEFIRK